MKNCLQLLTQPQQKMLSFSLLLIFTQIISICLGDYTENQYIDYYENQYYDEGGNFDKEVMEPTFMGNCSKSTKQSNINLTMIKTGIWTPYIFMKLQKMYLTPFFNPYKSLNCIKFEITINSNFIKIKYICDSVLSKIKDDCIFEFKFLLNGSIFYDQNSYNCESNKKMNDVSIIRTDYENFIIIRGCKNKQKDNTFKQGFWVLVKSLALTAVVRKEINETIEEIHDMELIEFEMNTNETIKTCDCSLACGYSVCYTEKFLYKLNDGKIVTATTFKLLEELKKYLPMEITVRIFAILSFFSTALMFMQYTKLHCYDLAKVD